MHLVQRIFLTAELWHCENQLNRTAVLVLVVATRVRVVEWNVSTVGVITVCHGANLNHSNTSDSYCGQCVITSLSICIATVSFQFMPPKYLPWAFPLRQMFTFDTNRLLWNTPSQCWKKDVTRPELIRETFGDFRISYACLELTPFWYFKIHL